MGEACAERVQRGGVRSASVFVFVLLSGCFPDDWDGSPYQPDGATVSVGDTSDVSAISALVGSWRSEGDDLSPLFSGEPFHYVRVDSDFAAGGGYSVTSVGPRALPAVRQYLDSQPDHHPQERIVGPPLES